MVMDVPAGVVLAEIVIEFGAAADDAVKGIEAEIACLAQLAAELGIFDAATQRPDGIDKGQAGKFHPGNAEVEDFVGMIGAQKIEGGIADEENEIAFSGGC